MSKVQIIILACVAIFLFMTYLLISLLSKISRSAKADYSKTMDELEKDRPFKL
jgi:hypothetical protein